MGDPKGGPDVASSSPHSSRLAQLTSLVVAVGLFFAVDHFVRATPNGPTKDMLSFGGTLMQNGKPLPGAQMLTFTFKKNGQAVCAPQSMVTPDAVSGAFDAQIDVSTCPGAGLFDGGDVAVDLSVGGSVIAQNQPLNPVPYAKYADQAGSPDCPATWVRDRAAMGMVLCKKGADQVVKVGAGATAFWIDRYESSMWQNPDGTGAQYGLVANDANAAGFLSNGQWTVPAYALSKSGVMPATSVTWFQANAACRLAGKRLARNSEWMTAAGGTVDPGASNGMGGQCLTQGGGVRMTGAGTACTSLWGAEDMIGNAEEMVDEWNIFSTLNGGSNPWPNGYNGDVAFNIGNVVSPGDNLANLKGIPGILARGGNFGEAATAGVFSMNGGAGPTYTNGAWGFRCVVPR